MKKLMLILKKNTMEEIQFHDLISREDVETVYVFKEGPNALLNVLRRFHTSIRVMRWIDLPLKNLWSDYIWTNNFNDCTHVMFCIDSYLLLGAKTLKKIQRSNPKKKFILLLLDSLDAHSYSIVYCKKYIFDFKWDKVLSYDIDDCKKHGFTYIGLNYYSKMSVKDYCGIYSDLFYIGTRKDNDGRMELLEKIIIEANKHNVKCNFNIWDRRRNSVPHGMKKLDKPMSYNEVIMGNLKSNCILELVQNNQKRQTARYMEAICYNKKLLTNNENVIKLPYYNPEYIKTFTTIDEIDFDWIKQNEEVDYGYRDDFSPVKLLEYI